MEITREQREAWVLNTKDGPFNLWLDRQVKNPDGALDLEKLYALAKRYGINNRYDNLNAGLQRMNIGNRLRKLVPHTEYSLTT